MTMEREKETFVYADERECECDRMVKVAVIWASSTKGLMLCLKAPCFGINRREESCWGSWAYRARKVVETDC